VTICLHQHVGTWIETAAEVDWLMERLDPELVALGPDTGHLAWAGWTRLKSFGVTGAE